MKKSAGGGLGAQQLVGVIEVVVELLVLVPADDVTGLEAGATTRQPYATGLLAGSDDGGLVDLSETVGAALSKPSR